MKGKYRIYDNDTLLAEFDNIITSEGKKVIGRFLAGQKSSWADAVAIGAGSTSPNENNKSLEMEFWRDEIDLKSYNESSGKISLRSRIPAPIVGKIFEIGLYYTPAADGLYFTSPLISNFNLSVEDWSTGAANTALRRIDSSALQISGGTSTEFDFEGDIRAFNNDTVFRLAYTADAGVSSVSLRLKSSDSDYREYSFTPASSSYQVEDWKLQDFSVIGNPEWGEIYQVEIIAAGSGNIVLDGFSAIDERPSNPVSILVSRALVSFSGENFFDKKPQRELQLEYILELDL